LAFSTFFAIFFPGASVEPWNVSPEISVEIDERGSKAGMQVRHALREERASASPTIKLQRASWFCPSKPLEGRESRLKNSGEAWRALEARPATSLQGPLGLELQALGSGSWASVLQFAPRTTTSPTRFIVVEASIALLHPMGPGPCHLARAGLTRIRPQASEARSMIYQWLVITLTKAPLRI